MVNKVVKALGSMIWDFLKCTSMGIMAIIGFTYLFSGFGVLIIVGLVEPLQLLPHSDFMWWVCLVIVLIIVGSWGVLLVEEIKRRIELQERS